MTEERALTLLKERDPAALDWFVRRYTAYVSTVIWNVIGAYRPRQDAEELTADVFLALWQSGDRPQAGKVRGYLGAIARHKAVSCLRARGVELGTEEDMLALAVPSPEGAVEERELARLVKEAVESLEPPDREIFLRFYYYCQSAGDIAQMLDMTPAAVRKRLERGREKLKRYLEERGLTHELYDIV